MKKQMIHWAELREESLLKILRTVKSCQTFNQLDCCRSFIEESRPWLSFQDKLEIMSWIEIKSRELKDGLLDFRDR